ncbi:MAG: zinc-finger domain-containing protein [Granulosicoccus sp.]
MQELKTDNVVEVTRDELPVYCPVSDAALWSSHPRQFIPLGDAPEASCSYCGTVFRLVDNKGSNE